MSDTKDTNQPQTNQDPQGVDNVSHELFGQEIFGPSNNLTINVELQEVPREDCSNASFGSNKSVENFSGSSGSEDDKSSNRLQLKIVE